jgi:hypothetical protein
MAPLAQGPAPAPGQVGAGTVFRYHERDGQVWATYQGGDIARGYLVGTREEDRLDFRYVQLTRDGSTAAGHCVSRVVELPDGRLRLEETWEWESRPGDGSSVVEEIRQESSDAVSMVRE